MSNAEEIAKYKQLLDDRVITQEDFDKKKNELLSSSEGSNVSPAVSYTHLTLPTILLV